MSQRRANGLCVPGLFFALAFAAGGCSFGPQVLERSHLRYNEAVKQVDEEQLLLNLVRLRYNEDLVQLDVSAIATPLRGFPGSFSSKRYTLSGAT